jgi:hypothetical protein
VQAKGPSWENGGWSFAWLCGLLYRRVWLCENPSEVGAAICKQLAPYALNSANPLLVIEQKTTLETAALNFGLDTSHDKFNRLCKHTPNLFQPLHKVGKLWKPKDFKLEEIRDDDQKLIGFCVKHLKNSVVIPKLRQYLADWKLKTPPTASGI